MHHFVFRSKWTELYRNVRNPIKVYGVPIVSVCIRMQTERKLHSVPFSCLRTEQLTELGNASVDLKVLHFKAKSTLLSRVSVSLFRYRNREMETGSVYRLKPTAPDKPH